jgi:hypothetical protein
MGSVFRVIGDWLKEGCSVSTALQFQIVYMKGTLDAIANQSSVCNPDRMVSKRSVFRPKGSSLSVGSTTMKEHDVRGEDFKEATLKGIKKAARILLLPY